MGIRFQQRLATLLAAWVAVIGCGVSFTHDHETDDLFHHHGFGLGATAQAAKNSPPGEGLGCRHGHWILFGLEVSGGHAPVDCLPPSPAEIHHVGSLMESVDCESPYAQLNTTGLLPHGSFAAPWVDLLVVTSSSRPADHTSITSPCFAACLCMSGVMRV